MRGLHEERDPATGVTLHVREYTREEWDQRTPDLARAELVVEECSPTEWRVVLSAQYILSRHATKEAAEEIHQDWYSILRFFMYDHGPQAAVQSLIAVHRAVLAIFGDAFGDARACHDCNKPLGTGDRYAAPKVYVVQGGASLTLCADCISRRVRK